MTALLLLKFVSCKKSFFIFLLGIKSRRENFKAESIILFSKHVKERVWPKLCSAPAQQRMRGCLKFKLRGGLDCEIFRIILDDYIS